MCLCKRVTFSCCVSERYPVSHTNPFVPHRNWDGLLAPQTANCALCPAVSVSDGGSKHWRSNLNQKQRNEGFSCVERFIWRKEQIMEQQEDSRGLRCSTRLQSGLQQPRFVLFVLKNKILKPFLKLLLLSLIQPEVIADIHFTSLLSLFYPNLKFQYLCINVISNILHGDTKEGINILPDKLGHLIRSNLK